MDKPQPELTTETHPMRKPKTRHEPIPVPYSPVYKSHPCAGRTPAFALIFWRQVTLKSQAHVKTQGTKTWVLHGWTQHSHVVHTTPSRGPSHACAISRSWLRTTPTPDVASRQRLGQCLLVFQPAPSTLSAGSRFREARRVQNIGKS